MRGVPWLIFALSSQAIAASPSFEADLARLKTREATIDATLQGLSQQTGVSLTNGWRMQSTNDGDGKAVSLIRLHSDLTVLRLPVGKAITCRLRNRLVVGSEGSPAILVVAPNQGALSGVKVLGKARQSGTPGRVLMDLERLVFANGRAQVIKASALDDNGAYGLEAQVFSSKAIMLAGAMAGSMISGFAAAQQNQTTTAFGFQQSTPGLRNGILQGVAQSAAEQSKRLIDESTTEKPVLVVEAGQAVLVYFEDAVRY